MKKHLLLILISCFSIINVDAQLTGFANMDGISVNNTTNVDKSNYQILITIDTKSKIAASKMKADGSDIRFSSNCNGTPLLNYFIESGINTENTKIWVMLPSFKKNLSTTFFMFYGNSSATVASNFALTFPKVYKTNTAELIGSSVNEWNYDWVEIVAGSIVKFDPQHGKKFTINARKIIIAGDFYADSLGYKGGIQTSGDGPGGGGSAVSGGGGGGYGSRGGNGAWCCDDSNTYMGKGGMPYEMAMDLNTIDAGSGGGAADLAGVYGGSGGMGISLKGASIDISGNIFSRGSEGSTGFDCGGGGAGGGIQILATDVNFTGTLNVAGGKGGSTSFGYGGGGGAGGRIKIGYQNKIINTGKAIVKGGTRGAGEVEPSTKGGNGSFFVGPFLDSESIPFVTEGISVAIKISSTKDSICAGSESKFIAIAGNGGDNPIYNWKKNEISIPDQNTNTLIYSDLVMGDSITCSLVSNSTCAGTPEAESNVLKPRIDAPVSADFTQDKFYFTMGDSINFTSLSPNAKKWFWDFGDETTSTLQNPSHTYTTYGDLNIVHAVTNGDCTDTLIRPIVISEFAGIPNLLNKSSSIQISPNPFNTHIKISNLNEKTELNNISILDVQGKIIFKQLAIQNNSVQINLESLNSGVYILRVENKDGISIGKIVKN